MASLWSLRERIAELDARADAAFDRLRGNPVADRVFYSASAIGENSKVWMVLTVLRWLRGRPTDRFFAKRAWVAIFAESAIVNLGIKSMFRRSRPDHSGDHPFPLREPWTSSFPSGHATAAFCSATLLSEGDPVLAPAYFALAGMVAASRVHVKMHHASDVLGGVAIGLAFGWLVRKIAPLPESHRGERSRDRARRR